MNKKIDNKKILCFSATVNKGFELSDLLLVEKLNNNFQVSYAVKSNEMYKKYTPENEKKKINFIKKFFYNYFDNECGFPGFNEDFKRNTDFINFQTIWIYRWSQLKKLIKKTDILILGSFRNNEWIIEYARRRNKIVILHKNPANIDSEGEILPNIYFTKNKYETENIKKKIYEKKISNIASNDVIHEVGSLQYEYSQNLLLEKGSFFKKYNLDPNKKTFIFFPSAPQIQNEYYQEDYKKIVDIIERNHNVIIKGHPTDYSKRKLRKEYGDLSSWEYLLTKPKVLSPEDFYSAIKYCDAGISIFSTIFLELNFFRKPIIFVNRYDHYAYNILNKKKNIDYKFYDQNIKKNFYEFGVKFLDELSINKNELINNKFLRSSPELLEPIYEYIGCDLKIDQLENFINKFKLSDINFDDKEEKIRTSEQMKNIIVNYLNNSFKDNFLTKLYTNYKISKSRVRNIIRKKP